MIPLFVSIAISDTAEQLHVAVLAVKSDNAENAKATAGRLAAIHGGGIAFSYERLEKDGFANLTFLNVVGDIPLDVTAFVHGPGVRCLL